MSLQDKIFLYPILITLGSGLWWCMFAFVFTIFNWERSKMSKIVQSKTYMNIAFIPFAISAIMVFASFIYTFLNC